MNFCIFGEAIEMDGNNEDSDEVEEVVPKGKKRQAPASKDRKAADPLQKRVKVDHEGAVEGLLQASDSSAEHTDNLCRLIFKAIARETDDENQSVNLQNLFAAL